MVARTVKIMGLAYSTGAPVSITVDYNGSRVFTGNVPTTTVDVLPSELPISGVNWIQELGVFTTDTDTTGVLPATISITGGKIFFGHFRMNYIGPLIEPEQTDPNIPINLEDPTTFVWVVIADTASNYGDPNTNTVESDGVTNTRLNGETWIQRTNVGTLLGDWVYPMTSGDVFEFDFFVNPNQIVL